MKCDLKRETKCEMKCDTECDIRIEGGDPRVG